MMLKLRMCSRKRTKRHRAIPNRLRLPSTTTSTSSNLMDIEELDYADHQGMILSDNLQSMLKQERSGKYDCPDYLNTTSWHLNEWKVGKKNGFELVQQCSGSGGGTSSPIPSASIIDEYCREQIVEWSFRVVDYFRIDREVVAVSLSFLDRFLGTCRCDRTSFKLAATTTLHLAVKLLYPCKLADLGILSDLSRGEFDMTDVCRMESNILHTLSWNLHPPTPSAFSCIFLDYFFSSRVVTISSTDLDDIYDVSSFFCELAVCDYSFTRMRASTIGMASILNALEGMFGPDNLLSKDIMHAARCLNLTLPQEIHAARSRMWDLYERSEECALHNDKSKEECNHPALWHSGIFVKKASALSSPVSVSKPCHSATDFVCSSHEIAIRNESW